MILLESAFNCADNTSNGTFCMLKNARLNLIVETVNERKFVSLKELMDVLGASESTVRADLVELAKQGRIIRLRGGAQALNSESLSYELSMEDKLSIQTEAKRGIAEYAASLVPEHSLIYIDAGSTTYFMAEYLKTSVKAVTNSMTLARALASHGVKAYVIGGELKLSTEAFIGTLACNTLAQFHFDYGFFGTTGVDLEHGFTTPEFEEANVKSAAMAQCKKVYVLADSTKFGTTTAITFHPLDDVTIITERIKKDIYRNANTLEVNPA